MSIQFGKIKAYFKKEIIKSGFFLSKKEDAQFTMVEADTNGPVILKEGCVTRILMDTIPLRCQIIADIVASSVIDGYAVVIIDTLNSHPLVLEAKSKEYAFASVIKANQGGDCALSINQVDQDRIDSLLNKGGALYLGLDHDTYFNSVGKTTVQGMFARLRKGINGRNNQRKIILVLNSVYDYMKKNPDHVLDVDEFIGNMRDAGVQVVVVDKNVYIDGYAQIDEYQTKNEILVYRKPDFLESPLKINGLQTPELDNDSVIIKDGDGDFAVCQVDVN